MGQLVKIEDLSACNACLRASTHRQAQAEGISKEDFSKLMDQHIFDGLSPLSKDVYKGATLDFFSFVGNLHPFRVTDNHINLYKEYLLSSHKKSTAINKLRGLKKFFDRLSERASVDNPFDGVRIPSADKPSVRGKSLSYDQAVRLLRSIPRTDIIGVRDYAIILLMLYEGLRASEVCSINIEDFFYDGDQLYLRVKGKGNKKREVKVHPAVWSAIEDYLKVDGREANIEGSLFLSEPRPRNEMRRERMNRVTLWFIVKGRTEKAGLRNVHPHTLRHTCATLSYKSGASLVSLKDHLGHSKMDTTVVYTHDDTSPVDYLNFEDV